jgi:hypothetical protein
MHAIVRSRAPLTRVRSWVWLHRRCSAVAVVKVQRGLRWGGSSGCIALCCAVLCCAALYLLEGCRAWSAETVSPMSCRACSCARTRRAHHDRSRRALHMARPPPPGTGLQQVQVQQTRAPAAGSGSGSGLRIMLAAMSALRLLSHTLSYLHCHRAPELHAGGRSYRHTPY